jgi:hypothetical protein
LIDVGTRPSHRRFLTATEHPEQAQALVWREITPLLRESEWWRPRFRPRLQDYDITTLDVYRPAIERSLATGLSLLNHERVLFWSQSAGTTGDQKLFPMTSAFRQQFQRTVPPMVQELLRRYPRFLLQPALYFAATDPQKRSATGADIGYISNYNYRTIPRIMRSRYAFPREIFRDADTFDRLGPVYALQTDLSAMFAVTPISLRQLIANIRQHREFVLRCLRTNGPPEPGLPAVTISPERLASVTRQLEADNLSFRTLWPSLSFVCAWKTAVCEAHLNEVAPFLEGIDVIDAIYSATEGWITVPVMETGGSVVHPGAHIFEFIEVGQEIASRNLLPLWALTPGRRYEIFLTTAMGLVRYRLYDVVACTGLFNRAPVIEFAHKSGGIISLGLVSVSESELIECLRAAGLRLRAHWRVGPNASGDGLVLYTDAAAVDLSGQLQAADDHLKSINVNYRTYRDNATVQPLTSATLPPGHRLWSSGAAHAQSKPVLLIQTVPD